MDGVESDRIDWDRRSYDDNMMLLAFGCLNPAVAYLPHCIFIDTSDAVKAILEVVGAKGGIWGAEPWFDLGGNEYIPPWDPDPDDFILWEAPRNQERILRGGYCISGQFTMVIDSRTPAEVLAKSYSIDRDELTLCQFLDYVHGLMDDLRWACIPLQEDVDCTMFVAKHTEEGLVTEVEARLRRMAVRVFRLRRGENRFHWDHVLDPHCRPDAEA